MIDDINKFIKQLSTQPELVSFDQVLQLIDQYYDFTPTAFTNGEQRNNAGENSASCKVFSFAMMNNLDTKQTLLLFCQYYFDVMATPTKNDHQNIRQFMKHGFKGLKFDGQALNVKGEA